MVSLQDHIIVERLSDNRIGTGALDLSFAAQDWNWPQDYFGHLTAGLDYWRRPESFEDPSVNLQSPLERGDIVGHLEPWSGERADVSFLVPESFAGEEASSGSQLAFAAGVHTMTTLEQSEVGGLLHHSNVDDCQHPIQLSSSIPSRGPGSALSKGKERITDHLAPDDTTMSVPTMPGTSHRWACERAGCNGPTFPTESAWR
jgi:hypothetical protein